MTLAAGSRVGPYEVIGSLGAGGMGEVYRARDSKLARDVALKILPETFAVDPDRLSRFEREAQLLASLNHPNIAAIYGLEDGSAPEGPAKAGHDVRDVRALVLELVEGPTLADRLVHGPIAIEEALPVARQIAEALEAAHAHGVVHRDLKPSNVKVRSDGVVKVLDFGLAKALDPMPTSVESSLSPTMTSPAMTRLGVIIGTAAYMSPEQARGFSVDSRADIWAFGVVLFEMLTGRTLFDGATVSDTMAAVLRADIDWRLLPADLPAGVRTVLARCLQRDPKRRVQHIGDARLEIEDAQNAPVDHAVSQSAGARVKPAVLAAAIATALAGPLAWYLKPAPPAASQPPIRFAVATPYNLAGARMSMLDISPDGRHLVYVAVVDGTLRLFQHSLDAFAPQPLEDSEGAWNPFVSPKGDAVGFWSSPSGQLRQLKLGGGAATRLVDIADSTGSSWGDDGTLVLSPGWGQSLRVVRPGSSTSDVLTHVNRTGNEGAHLRPQLLPDGRSVLFTVWSGAPTWDEAQLAMADLSTGAHTIVMRGAASGRYVSSGHLVFWRGNALLAAPFDLESRKVTGEAVRVVAGVRLDNFSGAAHYAVSHNGTLAYVSGGVDAFTESYLADRDGRMVARLDESIPTGEPSFSPDGSKVALTIYGGGTFGVGVFDVKRRLLARLPVAGDSETPTWKGADRLTFVSNASGDYKHYEMPSDGSGQPEVLFPGGQEFAPSQSTWSPDGRHYLFVKSDAKTGTDIWMHTPGTKDTPERLLPTPANENSPTFSPDGHFVAYHSDESGTPQIYVRPFPKVLAGREQISRSGGRNPKWSREGILYVSPDGIMRVPVSTNKDGSLSFGDPSLALAMKGLQTFAGSPDGQTFAIERTPVEKAAREIHVVLNWFEELKKLAPR